MALRFAYTQNKRRYGSSNMPSASNAASSDQLLYGLDITPVYNENYVPSSHSEGETSRASEAAVIDLDQADGLINQAEFDEQALDEGNFGAIPDLTTPIAVFPQYLTQAPTTMIICEVDLPRFDASFIVFLNGTTEALFNVRHDRSSLSENTVITDVHTKRHVLNIHRDTGALPRSYRFEDVSGKSIISLQANCFVPTQGTRATARFTNATDKKNVKLFMQGSWHNRSAAIKNLSTGDVIAMMTSDLLNLRTLVGSRRTYIVSVAMGVDLALVTAMIVALDARSD